MEPHPISDAWEQGSSYERYVGRWSREVAPLFLSWLQVPSGSRWLDVGCGTGALCATIVDRCAPASVTGVEPSEGFLRTASEHLAGRVMLHRGSATAIPLGNASVDAVVSGLVLNFVDDQLAAVLEMSRVTAPGGTIGAYLWDYAGRMEFLRHFWNAARAFDETSTQLDEGVRFPLCDPEALARLFGSAGLEGVEVRAIDVPTVFASFDDFWQPFLGGQGPAPSYLMTLGTEARDALRDSIRQRLPTDDNGRIALTARAWAVRGRTSG